MAKIIHIGNKGLELIKHFESFQSKPYMCPAHIPTIGYGNTYYPNGKKVTLQDPPISEQVASAYLLELIKSYELSVDAFCRDDINQNQFDALVSFAYNLGVNALKTSTLLKKVNTNKTDVTIRNEFMKWVNGGGKKLPGLVARRTAEADLYFS